MRFLRQSTAQVVTVGPFVDATDGVTAETTVTLGAADDAEIVKHGAGAVTDISGRTFTHVQGGMYNLSLIAGDVDTLGMLRAWVRDEDVCQTVWEDFMVLPQAVYDFLVSTGILPAGSVNASAIAADAITSGKIATDAIGSDELASSGISDIADAVWDELVAGHVVAGSFGEEVQAHALSTEVTTLPSALDNADAVWDELKAGHVVAGSFGEEVQAHAISTEIAGLVWDAPSASYTIAGSMGELQGLVSLAGVADAVWDELVAGHVVAGSFGDFMALIKTQADKVDLTAASASPTALSLAARIDNVSQEVLIITNISGTTLYIEVALEVLGVVDTSTTSAVAQFFDSANNLIFTVTAPMFGAPNGRGIFQYSWASHQLTGGNIYQVLVTIDGTVQTTKQIKHFAG
jgi:hypothetical protein